MENWSVEWRSRLKIVEEESPLFSDDKGVYYLQPQTSLNFFVSNGYRCEWVEPNVGFREYCVDADGLVVPDKVMENSYFARVYAAVITRNHYEQLANHLYLMQYGGQLVGSRVMACDFSGITKSRLKGFILWVGQKRFETIQADELDERYYVRGLPTPIEEYRSVVVQKLESVQKNIFQGSLVKNDARIYYEPHKIATYFRSIALGRVNDASYIFSNLETTNVIIPGDGFGIFTEMGRLMGKNVISGEKSVEMVKFARTLGTELVCEDGINTVLRGFEKFGIDSVVFISFLWTMQKELFFEVRKLGMKMLVYDKFIYYSGSSQMQSYGSRVLRGDVGIGWKGYPIELSEEINYHIDKPLLTEITKGNLYVDSFKGLRQLILYSEMYPSKLRITKQSCINPIELFEISMIHKFQLVDGNPSVRLIRCPHNARGLSWDIDTWTIIALPLDVNKYIIGSIPREDILELFDQPLISKGIGSKGKGSKRKRKKIVVPPHVSKQHVVSNQTICFHAGGKYYLKSVAKLTPYVRPIFDNGKVQLVWLRGGTYVYEEDQPNVYVRYQLSS